MSAVRYIINLEELITELEKSNTKDQIEYGVQKCKGYHLLLNYTKTYEIIFNAHDLLAITGFQLAINKDVYLDSINISYETSKGERELLHDGIPVKNILDSKSFAVKLEMKPNDKLIIEYSHNEDIEADAFIDLYWTEKGANI